MHSGIRPQNKSRTVVWVPLHGGYDISFSRERSPVLVHHEKDSFVPVIVHDRVTGYSYFVDADVPVIWPAGQSIRYLSPTTFPEGSVAELHILEAMGLSEDEITTALRISWCHMTGDVDWDAIRDSLLALRR